MRAKTAIAYAETVCVICPYCNSPIHDPQVGSLVWQPEQVGMAGMITCQECGERSWAPGKVRMRGDQER